MKTEGDCLVGSSKNSEITFGPTWLKQFSSNENNKSAPEVAFQLAKYRYGIEEMLSIYENIEKALFNQAPPVSLAKEFEDLFKKDLQSPCLLKPASPEEQKSFSTCVNSQLALNTYNKQQGHSGSSSSTGRQQNSENNSSRGGSNSARGSRGSGFSNRGGRVNRVSEGENTQVQANTSTTSTRGGARGGYNRGSYTRTTNTTTTTNWKDKEPSVKREYSRPVYDNNWRDSIGSKEEDELSEKEAEREPIVVAPKEPEVKQENKSSSSKTNLQPVNDNIKKQDFSNNGNISSNEKTNARNSKDSKNQVNNQSTSNNVAPSTTSSSIKGNSFNQNDAKSKNEQTFGKERPQARVQQQGQSQQQYQPQQQQQQQQHNYYQQQQNRNRNYNENYDYQNKREPYRNRKPEWFDDENDEEISYNAEDSKMTFDESGKFVHSKDLVNEDKKHALKENKLRNYREKETSEEFLNKAKNPEASSSANSTSPSSRTQAKACEIPQGNQTIQNEPEAQNADNELKSNENLNDESQSDPSMMTDFKRIASESQQSMIDADRWFFIDSQNQVQGSFSSEQMAAWYEAGYFSMSLMIKRGKNEKFLPLSVYISNFGRVPFLSDAQFKQQQLFQQMQQLQLYQQNLLLSQQQQQQQQKSAPKASNLNAILQQLQQLQLQQKAAVAQVNNLGANTVQSILNDIRMQQEVLISQINAINNKQGSHLNSSASVNQFSDPSIIDPAILDASLQALRASSSNNLKSVSMGQNMSNNMNLMPNNPLVSQLLTSMISNSNNNIQNSQYQMLGDNLVKDKIQLMFDQAKKDDEKRRKMEEIQLKLNRKEEEERLLEEIRFKQQEELKRLEEYRMKEDMRKEMQRKKLEEIIKKQEEDKRKNEDKMKRLNEQKIIELFQKKQEQLSQAQQWGKQYQHQMPNVDVKTFLEQKAMEQQYLMEHLKQQSEVNLSSVNARQWTNYFDTSNQQ